MKAIFYDWGGANAWLFYLINGFHSPWWDRFMLAGTALSAHSNFPPLLKFKWVKSPV